ncbi:lysosomal acid lipase/cholesteryl ester hydrolase [Marchantia polymorpha subsp. ruderalis]|uniref:Lipase n=2 Tax=Marchantia polymorpha TaxID=3197 RepID=A0A176WBM8_MARPO|nr:hypothetical protein AXG93_1433s1360 [Marchantia polymorpha subsp. ruderalis]PTQ33164.1 hypothetical protein MARPO_0091s0026 [Marchantia polymorpha]BBN15650.1 hypothetical protein Mp_6g21290 [Marchantia polymorpha subsp. ruderalis]|eukprot:PTQ33164.1 hypothetical protein MARPO_0091s0026 [Marchantia polymorpha]
MGTILNRTRLFFIVSFLAKALQIPLAVGKSQSNSLCAELIWPKGYPCDEITVETADGFLLGLQHIPFGVAGPSDIPGPAVLLVHGLTAGGDNYVVNDPKEDLALILADAGFDVYIGSNRNTRWSHGSSKYKPEEKAYWDWTLDELAAFDVPAFVEYVYNKRGGSKIFYIGHSQGTLTLMAGLTGGGTAAEQMKDKLRGVVFLAPVAYVTHLSAALVGLLFNTYADQILPLVGIGPADSRILISSVCKLNADACSDLLRGYIGTNSYLNSTRRPTYLKYFPQPTSSYNLNHFGQIKRSEKFGKYDRGPKENLERYGQEEPPLYQLAKFPSESFPQLFFTGGIDQLADPSDTKRLLQELPTSGVREVINLPEYGHGDFVLAQRANIDVYSKIVSFFKSN